VKEENKVVGKERKANNDIITCPACQHNHRYMGMLLSGNATDEVTAKYVQEGKGVTHTEDDTCHLTELKRRRRSRNG
jgi:hypothetical protein